MFRMSLAYFFRIGEVMRPLRDIKEDTPNKDAFLVVQPAINSLKDLLENPIVNTVLIKTSVNSAQNLLLSLEEFNKSIDWNEEAKSTGFKHFWAISENYANFSAVFNSEMETANAYLVTNKGAYDPNKLISAGETLFRNDLLEKVPDALTDVQELGRCLAFELATACGFHTMRLLETVLKSYWKAVSGGKPQPKNPNLGIYLVGLEKLDDCDELAVSTLRSIKDLHRNPLIHPENNLSVEEAMNLVAIASSAISYMLEKIEPFVLTASKELNHKSS